MLSFLRRASKSEDMENYPRWDELLDLCSFFKKGKISGKKKKRKKKKTHLIFSLEQYE